MKRILVIISMCVSIQLLAQTPTLIDRGEKLTSVQQKIRDGYTTQIGWTLKEGDIITLGKGTMPNRTFAFIYQSPVGWTSMSTMDMQISKNYLRSNLAGKTAKIKDIMPIGSRKPGYTIIAKIGLGEMVNYWVEIDNALDAGEIVPPKEFADKMPKNAPAHTVIVNQGSVADELKKLKELLDAGAITQDEYETQKKKILAQ